MYAYYRLYKKLYNTMATKKKDYKIYTSTETFGKVSVQANISDLIKKNKREEKQNKIRTIYSAFLFIGTIIFLGTYIYL